MNNFRDLDVWKKSVKLATIVCKATENYPKSERYGLSSQLCRCAVSISSNIAEGAGRRTKKDFSRFLDIATGSCYELETQLTISQNVNYLSDENYRRITDKLVEIQKMIYSLRQSLK